MNRVAALGFSLGGAAALSISGAGLSKEDFLA
jgi:predicted dienelactone hydrolase